MTFNMIEMLKIVSYMMPFAARCLAKDARMRCEKASFSRRKGIIWHPLRHLLQRGVYLFGCQCFIKRVGLCLFSCKGMWQAAVMFAAINTAGAFLQSREK